MACSTTPNVTQEEFSDINLQQKHIYKKKKKNRKIPVKPNGKNEEDHSDIAYYILFIYPWQIMKNNMNTALCSIAS